MNESDSKALARGSDPDSAHAAAESVNGRLPNMEARVLVALGKRGSAGATTRELAVDLCLDLVTVSPRLRPLTKKNLVRDSGQRRVGKSGRASVVWILAAFANST